MTYTAYGDQPDSPAGRLRARTLLGLIQLGNDDQVEEVLAATPATEAEWLKRVADDAYILHIYALNRLTRMREERGQPMASSSRRSPEGEDRTVPDH